MNKEQALYGVFYEAQQATPQEVDSSDSEYNLGGEPGLSEEEDNFMAASAQQTAEPGFKIVEAQQP